MMDFQTSPTNPLVDALARKNRCDALRSPDYLNLSLSL